MKDFISKMANSIYNYAISKNISGISAQYCENLAWGTMYGYDLFNQTLTPQQQLQNGNTAAIEQDNLQGAKGTPCN